jgi:threonylcarbamoyladenosine tRNA methylthiotransferase MtaB
MRGETEEYFEQTYHFLDSLDISQLHVFPYSERPGTAALKIPLVVSEREKKARSARLLALSEQKTRAFYQQRIGQEAEVLMEKATRGRAMHGFTRNYVRVELPAGEANPSLDNQIVVVSLGDFNHDATALMAHIKTDCHG